MIIIEKSGKMLKTAVFMSAAVMLSKALGMLRDILLAANYGTTDKAVAFETASRLPILIFDFLIGGVITATFIPIFNELLVKKDKNEALKFANNYLNFILLISTVVALTGVVFAGGLVNFLAPDIAEETKALSCVLTRIMFPMIIFTGLTFSFVGILQSFGEFNLPAIISLVSNGIMVLYFYTFNKQFGIFGLSVAMLVGWGAQALIQIPKIRKTGYRYSFSLDLHSPYIKQAFLTAIPILVGTWTQPICTLINTRYASAIQGGRAINALSYANRLYIIIVGIFSFVATNLLFPYLSKASASGEKEQAKKLTLSSVKILTLVISPITAGFIVLSSPVISVIYERGSFTPADVSITAEALSFYAVGMIFMAANEVFTKAFFARKKTKIPMVTSIISMTANFIFVLILAPTLKTGGIALSSGLAIALNCVLNYLFMLKLDKTLFILSDFLNILKMLISSALMGIAVYFLYHATASLNKYLSLLICITGGVLIYFLLCVILRVDEMKIIKNFVKRK